MESLTELVKDVLQKLEDQNQIILLLQNRVDFQNDRITKQDELIKQLTTKVEKLTTKFSQTNEENYDENENDSVKIWKGAKNLSLADVVKETAEQTLMANSGFVYDTETKLYCNYSTGYYYDSAQELYYNGHTGTYYTYDADKQEYHFHSQVELPNSAKKNNKTEKIKNKPSKNKPKTSNTKKAEDFRNPKSNTSRVENDRVIAEVPLKIIHPIERLDEVEEGELSTSSSDNNENEKHVGVSENQSDFQESSSEEEDCAKQYPPCIRAIVVESNWDQIKKGTLFLVTCMGGSIGCEGLEHAILLPGPNIEKSHAMIQYMTDQKPNESKSEKYFIVDLGSLSGTFLNGKRLSEEKERSDPHEILHGSQVKIGGFVILMHIHPGSFTCGHCEPGLLMQADPMVSNESEITSKTDKVKSRNAMMRQIKKKYGIERQLVPQEMPDADVYVDRSSKRREIKGSDNPYEKTQVATLDESIGSSNKGFKMLAKMGWSAGKTLGQTGEQGLLEPIKLDLKSDRGGLGLTTHPSSSTTMNVFDNTFSGRKTNKKKHGTSKSKQSRADQLAITMKRFKDAAEINEELYKSPS